MKTKIAIRTEARGWFLPLAIMLTGLLGSSCTQLRQSVQTGVSVKGNPGSLSTNAAVQPFRFEPSTNGIKVPVVFVTDTNAVGGQMVVPIRFDMGTNPLIIPVVATNSNAHAKAAPDGCGTLFDWLIGDKSLWFWGMISALAATLGLTAIYQQIKLQRVANMLASFGSFGARWKSDEMVASRKAVCSWYLKKSEGTNASLEDVASFFEEIDLFINRKVFDISLVWEIYGAYVENYWPIFEPVVENLRKNDRSAYTAFENLHGKCVAYSATKGLSIAHKTKEELEKFANAESDD